MIAGGKAKRSFFERAVRNLLFTGLGTASSMVVGLLFGGLTIRYLGTARAGYLMLLVALTGFGSLLGDFGFGTAAVQRVAALCRQGELGTSRHIVSSVVTLSTVSAMVTAVPVVLFHARVFAWSQLPAVYRTDSFWATIFAMVTYVLTQATGAWRSTYTSLERFDISSGLSTTFGILNGTAGIIVLHICPTMAAASFVRLVTSVIRVGTDAYFAGRLLRGTPWPGLYWREVKPLIGFGMWIYASNVGNFFLGRVNSFILTTMLGASALPFYEFPQRIYLQVHGALNNQSTFLFPMFASYGGSAAEEIEKRQDRLRWILAVISGAAYVAIALLGVPILRHLVNAEFAALARWCLILACVQGFFEAQTIVPSSSSWALGAGQPNAIIEIIRGVLVAVTAWLLIPRIGYNGAAIAQLWTIPIVVIHAIWVQALISPQDWSCKWWRAYISPALMVITWITLGSLTARALGSHALIPALAGNALGAVAGAVVLWFTETRIFSSDRRWALLAQTVTSFAEHVHLIRRQTAEIVAQ